MHSKYKNNTIYQFDLNGKLVKRYRGIYSVIKQTGISLELIRMNLSGNIKSTHGYVFTLDKNFKLNYRIYTRYENRPIYQFNIEGKLLNTYNGLNETVKQTGIKKEYITTVLNKRQLTTMGYIFSIDKDPEWYVKKINETLIHKYKGKKIYWYGYDGDYLGEFDNVKQASKETGVPVWAIVGSLKLERYTSYGYIFSLTKDIQPRLNKILNSKRMLSLLDIEYLCDFFGNQTKIYSVTNGRVPKNKEWEF